MIDNRIKVGVRIRPLNAKEASDGLPSTVSAEPNGRLILASETKENTKIRTAYKFDWSYGPQDTQRMIYDDMCKPLIEKVFEGYNATFFAYGQTGAGKTYTMGTTTELQHGVLPYALQDIFQKKDELLQTNSSGYSQISIELSYLEIYLEECYDLLSQNTNTDKKRLELRESPQGETYLEGLSSVPIQSIQDVVTCISQAHKVRSTGKTAMNLFSSRSHAICMITVRTSVVLSTNPNPSILVARLNLVDLAGSERVKKTLTTGDTFLEGVKINQGLSTLGKVVTALSTKQTLQSNSSNRDTVHHIHVPYRESKLTRLLKDSLGGNGVTCLLVCVSPAQRHFEETVSTLQFAVRTGCIVNTAKINQELSQNAETLLLEIESLKQQLLTYTTGGLNDNAVQQYEQQIQVLQNSNQLYLRMTYQLVISLKTVLMDCLNEDILIDDDEMRQIRSEIQSIRDALLSTDPETGVISVKLPNGDKGESSKVIIGNSDAISGSRPSSKKLTSASSSMLMLLGHGATKLDEFATQFELPGIMTVIDDLQYIELALQKLLPKNFLKAVTMSIKKRNRLHRVQSNSSRKNDLLEDGSDMIYLSSTSTVGNHSSSPHQDDVSHSSEVSFGNHVEGKTADEIVNDYEDEEEQEDEEDNELRDLIDRVVEDESDSDSDSVLGDAFALTPSPNTAASSHHSNASHYMNGVAPTSSVDTLTMNENASSFSLLSTSVDEFDGMDEDEVRTSNENRQAAAIEYYVSKLSKKEKKRQDMICLSDEYQLSIQTLSQEIQSLIQERQELLAGRNHGMIPETISEESNDGLSVTAVGTVLSADYLDSPVPTTASTGTGTDGDNGDNTNDASVGTNTAENRRLPVRTAFSTSSLNISTSQSIYNIKTPTNAASANKMKTLLKEKTVLLEQKIKRLKDQEQQLSRITAMKERLTKDIQQLQQSLLATKQHSVSLQRQLKQQEVSHQQEKLQYKLESKQQYKRLLKSQLTFQQNQQKLQVQHNKLQHDKRKLENENIRLKSVVENLQSQLSQRERDINTSKDYSGGGITRRLSSNGSIGNIPNVEKEKPSSSSSSSINSNKGDKGDKGDEKFPRFNTNYNPGYFSHAGGTALANTPAPTIPVVHNKLLDIISTPHVAGMTPVGPGAVTNNPTANPSTYASNVAMLQKIKDELGQKKLATTTNTQLHYLLTRQQYYRQQKIHFKHQLLQYRIHSPPYKELVESIHYIDTQLSLLQPAIQSLQTTLQSLAVNSLANGNTVGSILSCSSNGGGNSVVPSNGNSSKGESGSLTGGNAQHNSSMSSIGSTGSGSSTPTATASSSATNGVVAGGNNAANIVEYYESLLLQSYEEQQYLHCIIQSIITHYPQLLLATNTSLVPTNSITNTVGNSKYDHMIVITEEDRQLVVSNTLTSNSYHHLLTPNVRQSSSTPLPTPPPNSAMNGNGTGTGNGNGNNGGGSSSVNSSYDHHEESLTGSVGDMFLGTRSRDEFDPETTSGDDSSATFNSSMVTPTNTTRRHSMTLTSPIVSPLLLQTPTNGNSTTPTASSRNTNNNNNTLGNTTPGAGSGNKKSISSSNSNSSSTSRPSSALTNSSYAASTMSSRNKKKAFVYFS